jgi:hypothetical protein
MQRLELGLDEQDSVHSWLLSEGRLSKMKKANWQYWLDTLLFISFVGTVTIGFLLAFVIPKGPFAADRAKYFLGLHRHEWGDIHLSLGIALTTLVVVHLALGWKWIKAKTLKLFDEKWKAILLTTCLLPFLLLAVCWMAFPGGPGIYDQNDTTAARPDRGILRPGQLPPYDPSNATQTASVNTEQPRSRGNQSVGIPRGSRTSTKGEKQHPTAHPGGPEPRLTHGKVSEDTSGILITGQMTLREIERQTGISATVLAGHLGLPRSVSPDERLGGLRRRYSFTMKEARGVISSLLERRGRP